MEGFCNRRMVPDLAGSACGGSSGCFFVYFRSCRVLVCERGGEVSLVLRRKVRLRIGDSLGATGFLVVLVLISVCLYNVRNHWEE